MARIFFNDVIGVILYVKFIVPYLQAAVFLMRLSFRCIAHFLENGAQRLKQENKDCESILLSGIIEKQASKSKDEFAA